MTYFVTDDEIFEGSYAQSRRDRRLIQELVESRRSREAEGLTQERVAEIMGTTVEVVRNLESGRVDVRRRQLREYAVSIGMEIHYDPRPVREHYATEASSSNTMSTNPRSGLAKVMWRPADNQPQYA